MNIIDEIIDQQDYIIREGCTPKFISCNRQGFNELIRQSIVLGLPGIFQVIGVPFMEEYLELPIILNDDQHSRVKVLMAARDEYLYPLPDRETSQ